MGDEARYSVAVVIDIYFARFLFVLAVAVANVSPVSACDCIAPSLAGGLRRASAVFIGKAVSKKALPSMVDGRFRYEVRFSITESWKGRRSAEAFIYDAEPRGDCQGWGFEAGTEYLVFVRQRVVGPDAKVRVEGQDLTIPDLWNDVLAAGTKILIGEICNLTGKIDDAATRETIRLLGPPRWRAH
jgi:hypothetical protein